ncbi:MAG: YggS family pyridoxal phosphate-dependent enzyme [Clostridia bacterium]|nr:YggS family pyridoxal phosphate-dependent enzyme [Clostridia bacterium]
MGNVIDNLNQIEAKIKELCVKKGIDFNSIELIGASKFRTLETLKQLDADGRVKTFGENKVQEFRDKYDETLTWDIIGQLQTNKVKYVVGKVRYISSLDRLSLADEIERVASNRGVVQKCLIEVNSGDEECKGGIPANEVEDFLDKLKSYPHIKVVGIMAVAPQGVGEAELKKCFKKVSEVFKKIACKNPDFKVLSMGMSEDFLTAIECGSNQVRLGRILFGDRP